ncbi:F-BAR and double SH3 domains protein 1 isoform X3 [Ciconia boyciana]|uniref:F-BAR and double SH3 domains protein 1 isoform X3 n=1 Tax=Ciconia boyciana TaxID=52775 RepID=UPI003BA1EA09
MQPPPRKVKLTQEVRVHLLEQLSGLQGKQQRDAELLEDIRSYSKQRAAIDREYGQALQRLASQFVKRDWQRGRSEASDSRSTVAVWKGVIEGTAHAGQIRVTASESYRALAAEAARTTRLSKERMLKKGIERLQKAQAELLETVKELDKAKKQFTHLQRSSKVAKDKAADVEARLRKSDRRIFHTKASLQKLSAKFSARLAEHSRQLAGVQNEYGFALVSATAHLEHYRQVELPAAMQGWLPWGVRDAPRGDAGSATFPQALDGDLYERLREHLSAASRTEVETCQATRDWFQGVVEASAQVCREQDLLLFLQDHTAFALAPEQSFQLTGVEEVCLLPMGDDGASLEKEARRWATRVARDHKSKAHSEEMLQRLETRRQQVAEAEAATVERQMEEAKENIRKAEVSQVKAEARLSLLRAAGLDVDTWLAGAMVGAGKEAPAGLDPAEFDDYEDSDEPDEDDEPSPAAHTYPYTCRVIFGYQGCQADELSITQGEELEVIEDGDVEEWVKARNKAGQVGYVPEKYLLSLGGESGAGAGSPGLSALHRQLSSIMATELVLEPGAWLVRALYDYEGQSPEELSFPEGAIIRVLPRAPDEVDDGFWTGDFNGRVGVFPSLVVEELTGGQGAAGQELPSPSPPPFSPPGLVPRTSLAPSLSPKTPLRGECQAGAGKGAGEACRDLGSAARPFQVAGRMARAAGRALQTWQPPASGRSACPHHHPAEPLSLTPSCTSADPVGAPVPPCSPKSFTQVNCCTPTGCCPSSRGWCCPEPRAGLSGGRILPSAVCIPIEHRASWQPLYWGAQCHGHAPSHPAFCLASPVHPQCSPGSPGGSALGPCLPPGHLPAGRRGQVGAVPQ